MSTTSVLKRDAVLPLPLVRERALPSVDRRPAEPSLVGIHWLSRLELAHPRRDLQSLTPTAQFIKRGVDVVGAIVLLCLTWPLMLAAALLVKLTSSGPVFYKQVRVGLNLRRGRERRRNAGTWPGPPRGIERRQRGADRRESIAFGQPFVLYKFRTMRTDAEKNGARFAQANDSRVTPIGRFLRRTRIDELPQLWNVLKGEMSLIGPRPERPEFIAGLTARIPNYTDRLGLKPGLTGLAQVENGYDNELEGFRRKVAYDLLYLQNCCLRNDLKILLRTVSVVVTGKGAL